MMDWDAIRLSARLAFITWAILLPLATGLGYWLAITQRRIKPWLEGLLALPLVLPPTVIGFYLLLLMGNQTWLGQLYIQIVGQPLAFSFPGLVLASLLFNLPFAVQPIQRAFESIESELREAAHCCGLSIWQTFWRIELPLAWPGLLSASVMTLAHTLGEFGIVLMVGGNIPGETKTVAVAIYDKAQSFDLAAANAMSLLLLVVSLCTIAISYGWVEHTLRQRRKV